MPEDRVTFSYILKDNEAATALAIQRGDYLQAFLLVHALVESLLRAFLHSERKAGSFDDLITEYAAYLKKEHYPLPTFVDDLKNFNRRRNRIIHNLWQRGYTFANRQTEPATGAAVIMYGLLIEWLETFDPEIRQRGFNYQ